VSQLTAYHTVSQRVLQQSPLSIRWWYNCFYRQLGSVTFPIVSQAVLHSLLSVRECYSPYCESGSVTVPTVSKAVLQSLLSVRQCYSPYCQSGSVSVPTVSQAVLHSLLSVRQCYIPYCQSGDWPKQNIGFRFGQRSWINRLYFQPKVHFYQFQRCNRTLVALYFWIPFC